MFHKNVKSKTFNKTLWVLNQEGRKHQVSSLERSNVLIGLTKVEVLEKLGDEFNDINSSLWSYYIGTKTFFGCKLFFCIYFSDDGTVYKVKKR